MISIWKKIINWFSWEPIPAKPSTDAVPPAHPVTTDDAVAKVKKVRKPKDASASSDAKEKKVRKPRKKKETVTETPAQV